jgi:sec-independent protein translocase protein TatC
MSGALDEDTARTLANGRASVASVLSAAQSNLKKTFIVFLVFWLGSFYALRIFIWDRLKTDLVYNLMSEEVREATDIVATTPFEVILLQVKIGVIVGILGTIPFLVYFSRDSLRRRGYWPSSEIPRWKLWSFAVAIVFLFLGGVSYAYFLFFPIMFDFLAANAVQSGFKPTWSIALWTEFIFFLALSFGIAAQLPLAMSSVSRAGIVPYGTFRDKWRYAVVGIFVFGAMFSPPDPFTQVMWGVPLVLLYFISLGVTKFAVLSKQAGEAVSTRAVASAHWNKLAGSFALVVGALYMFWIEGGNEVANSLLDSIGSNYRALPAEEFAYGLPPTAVALAAGSVIALVVTSAVLFYYRIKALEAETEAAEIEAALAGDLEEEDTDDAPEPEPEPEPEPGDPATVDFGSMSANALETVPLEEFAQLDQEEVLEYAQDAVDEDNPKKARALMDSFEAAQELDTDDEDEEDVLTSTTTGMVDAFTDEETDEDDIGGYYYDITFILDSLTSKAIWIVAAFMVVMAGTFMFLYSGGIGTIQDIFFRNIPDQVQGQAEIVVLHPVEALIFMLKFSTLLGFVAVVPILLYFAWPAIEERGFSTGGNRNVLLLWGGLLTLSVIGGSLLGFLYIAPTVISLLATDVINSNMVIAYRINSFGWLVIYLTVGIGLLATIPMTMILFHHGSIIEYRRMRKSWRGVVLAFFAAAGLLSPSGIFTMFLVAIPAGLAYGFGLACLWVYVGVGRAVPSSRKEKTAD